MGSPSKLFFAISCCLVHVYGEIILLQYPYDTESRMRNWTCISKDDGTALAWHLDDEKIQVEDFKPKRQASGNGRDCAIRGESTCLAKWVETIDWRVVNSAQKPTGPVFDQRWEDFREFGNPVGGSWRYQKVGVANRSSGTMWFSGHDIDLGGFGVLLCENEQPHLSPCVGIRADNIQFRVQFCAPGAATPDGYFNISSSECTVEKMSENASLLYRGLRGWNTLRLEWNTEEKTVKIFLDDKSKLILEGPMPPWDKVSAVSSMVKYVGPRIRFHVFDYHSTDEKNAMISTTGIEHSGKIFCAELLAGLCPKCKLNVTLVDEDGTDIETWPVSGEEKDTYNGLLAWRLVRLNTSFDSDIQRRLALKIETILDGEEGAGEWAIDNFRICRSGQLRESTITAKIGYPACQKVSFTGTPMVKPYMYENLGAAKVLSEVQEFFRSRNEPLVGSRGFICNPNGCICDRGITGSGCARECADGFYGFSCKNTCESCPNSEYCDKRTGSC